jgi:MYXO-CTERM domain-containing protein
MMLDTPAVQGLNPGLPNQNALYAIGQANNLEPWFMSPAGMVAALNASDGAFHNYASYSTPNLNVLSRTIAQAIKDFSVPGSVLIRGGQHWVDINKVRATGNIGAGNAYTINAFYGRDPWPVAGTLGRNFMLSYNANPRSAWARLVTPVASGNIWRGNRVAVLEPQGPESIDNGLIDSTPAAPTQIPEINLSTALTDSTTDVAADSVLSALPEFTAGSFNSGDSLFEKFPTDPSTEGDWVIPYETSPGVITGAVAIDADTGTIDMANWDDPGTTMSLSDFSSLFTDVFSDNLVDDSGEAAPEPASLGVLAMGAIVMLRRRRS